MLITTPRHARRRRQVTLVVCLVLAALAVAAAPRLNQRPAPRISAEVSDPTGFARGTARERTRTPRVGGEPLIPAGRPARVRPHPDENPHSLGPAVVSADYVSGRVVGEQVLIGDVALPWTWWLEDDVAAIAGTDAVVQAVRAWDDQPGSRWASSFAGQVDDAFVVADGRSTIFLEADCEGLTTANSYLFTDGGLAIDRYGTRASQILEVDIGICPRVEDADTLARAVRHEVGHAIGLAHLCDRGDPCWEPAMGEGALGCRVMFWQARPCQEVLTAGDRAGLATLYPTLRPLSAPTAPEVTARAAFATVADETARVAVVAVPDSPAGSLTAAAALAARTGGPFLLGTPDAASCLDDPAGIEAARALGRRGTLVLVGSWPASCAQLAYDWDVSVRHVDASDPAAAAVELAAVRRAVSPSTADAANRALAGVGAVLVATDTAGAVPDDVAAAALAGRTGLPLLVVAGPDARVALAWLADAQIGRVAVVGPIDPAALADVRAQVDVVHLGGADRVATGIAVADALGDADRAGVVMTGADGGPERLATATVAASHGMVPVVTGVEVDQRVREWLEARRPPAGWAVGGEALLPSATRLAYATAVG